MEPGEVEAFVTNGQGALTHVAQGAEQLKRWADSFEQRGATPVFGNDALEMVIFSNDLQTWLTPERRATIARLRTDV